MKQSENHFVDIGKTLLPITIRKHRRSRRMIVRYQPLQKSVSLTLPHAVSIKQGLHFVSEKREWILKQFENYSGQTLFADGQIIPILGKEILLKHVGGRGSVSEGENILYIHGDAEFIARRMRGYLAQKAKAEIVLLAKDFSEKLNVKIKKISLRDTSSHWGSCSYGGNLSFSWRLIFAPYEVLRYVVAHEVCHIKEHNHSAEFWDLVEAIYPEYKTAKNWLKTNGNLLYKYG